jgi:hypothetical protein
MYENSGLIKNRSENNLVDHNEKVRKFGMTKCGWSDRTYLSQQRTYLLNRLHSKSLDLQEPVFIQIYGLTQVFSTFSRPQTTFTLPCQLVGWEDAQVKGLPEMKWQSTTNYTHN